jgi:hypothetical protein
MSAAELVAQLAAAGTPPELLAAVAQELFAGEIERNQLAERKRGDRERKAAQRLKSRDVTGQDVTDCDPSPFEVSPHTPLPKTPNQISPLNPPKSRVDYQRFGDAWNDMARKHGLPTVQTIGGKRQRAVAARYAEHGEQALFSAISMVPNCPHWMGENGWTGNFDSLMRPDNFQRMIEGSYTGKKVVAKITDARVVAENKRATAELYDKMGRDAEAAELRREAEQLERAAA